MSLQKFLVDNRLELIERTQAKVATRRFPHSSEAELRHGVPVFLSQLGAVLREQDEQEEHDLAVVSFDALQAGRVGSGGTTAVVFRNCLVEMRFLLDDPKRGPE